MCLACGGDVDFCVVCRQEQGIVTASDRKKSAVYIIAAVTLGYVFGNSVCGFDKLISGILIIAENECFRFMAKNCIAVYDEMLGVKYSKKKSKFKIDGVIAMLMGLLLCIEENGIEHYNPVEYLDAM